MDLIVVIAPNKTSKAISIDYNDSISEFKWGGLGKDEADFTNSHTIERHVGLSMSDLKRRIREEGLVVASSYINYGSANDSAMDVINSNIDQIEGWYNNSDKGVLTLKQNIGDIIGYYITTEQMNVKTDASKAMVILVRNNDKNRPFYVLTSFPYENKVEKKLRKKYGY